MKIHGVAASRGIAEGMCVLYQDELSFRDDEKVILVTDFLPPSVASLDPAIVGIVTEDGGILSHAACIAREVGIPCIVGVENAIEQLADKFITINGGEGEIYV